MCFESRARRLEEVALAGLPAMTSPAEGYFGTYLIGYDATSSLAGMSLAAGTDMRPGWWGPLIDLALGRAAMGEAEDDQTCVTLNLRIDLTGELPTASEDVLALGVLVSGDAKLPVTECEVRSSGGATIAHAVGRFMLVPGEKPAPLPAPMERPGADGLADLLGSTWPHPSDPFVMTVQPREAMGNPAGVVHGGVQAALLSLGMEVAAESDCVRPRLLDLAVGYRRPVMVSASELHVRSYVERRGRSISLLRSDLTEGSGPVLATALGTFDVRG